MFGRNTNKFSAIKKPSSAFIGEREKRQEIFHIKKNSRLHFYDIKIKVYVKKKRKSERKEKRTENEENEEERRKHLGRRLVDNIINDYNIEMIDIPTI